MKYQELSKTRCSKFSLKYEFSLIEMCQNLVLNLNHLIFNDLTFNRKFRNSFTSKFITRGASYYFTQLNLNIIGVICFSFCCVLHLDFVLYGQETSFCYSNCCVIFYSVFRNVVEHHYLQCIIFKINNLKYSYVYLDATSLMGYCIFNISIKL